MCSVISCYQRRNEYLKRTVKSGLVLLRAVGGVGGGKYVEYIDVAGLIITRETFPQGFFCDPLKIIVQFTNA